MCVCVNNYSLRNNTVSVCVWHARITKQSSKLTSAAKHVVFEAA